MQITTSLRSATLVGLSLVLAGCAVSQQGNVYKIGVDQNELTSSTLQEFRIGDTNGVVRRGPQGQLQIKLYDRMKVIDLGANVNAASVIYPIRFAQYDVLVVSVPTPACPYAHRIYQLNGYDVGMWDINNIPGRCSASLAFSRDSAGLMARQLSDRADRQAWVWSNGKLVGGLDPTATAVTRSGVIPAPTSAPPVPRQTSTAMPAPAGSNANGGTLSSAHFESGGAPAATETAGAASDTATARRPASAKRATPGAAPVAANASASKRIDAGNYEKLPAGAQSEITPVKIILRDSN
jgi:hypothetical protein